MIKLKYSFNRPYPEEFIFSFVKLNLQHTFIAMTHFLPEKEAYFMKKLNPTEHI